MQMPLWQTVKQHIKRIPIWAKISIIGMGALLLLCLSVLIFSRPIPKVWKYIPNEAIAVVETQKIGSLRWFIEEQTIFQTVKGLPMAQESLDGYDRIDTLQRLFPSLTPILYKETCWLSAHLVAYQTIGYVFYLPVGKDKKLLGELLSHFDLHTEKRSYKGREIIQLSLGGERKFTFILTEGLLIGSFHGVLIDDIIRHVESPLLTDMPWPSLQKVFYSDDSNGNEISVYWQHSQLIPLGKNFSQTQEQSMPSWLSGISKASRLKIQITESQIITEGDFLSNSSSDYPNTAIFEDQNPQGTNLPNWLPTQTAAFFRIGFSDSEKFWNDAQSEESREKLDNILDIANLDSESFQNCLGEEIGWACANYQAGEFQHQWLFAKITDKKALNENLLQLQNSSVVVLDSNTQWKAFSHHIIGEVPLSQFPRLLFGKPIGDLMNAPNSFCFTQIGDYWVIANSAKAINALLEALATQHTLAHNFSEADLEKLSQKHHLSGYIQPAYLQEAFNDALAEHWKAYFWPYRRQFNEWKQAVFMLDWEEEKLWGMCQQNVAKRYLADTAIIQNFQAVEIPLPVAPKTQPYLYLSDNEKVNIFFQDKWNRANLISSQGKRLWTVGLPGYISNKPEYITWAKGTAEGMMFTCGNRVYLLNELGHNGSGFPLYPPTKPIQHFGFYRADGQSRISVSDPEGNIYLYNQFRQARVGWQPKRLDGELATPLQQTRIADEYFYVGLEKKGILHVADQFGRSEAGFPISLGESVEDFMLEVTDSASKSYIKLLTTKGNLMTISFLGQVTQTKAFPRTQVDAKFQICRNEVKKDRQWLVARQEDKQVSIFTREGQRLLNYHSETEEPKIIQYFVFNMGVKLIGIGSPEGNSYQLFGTDGVPITILPYATNLPISIYYDVDSRTYFSIYSTDKTLKVEVLDL